MAAVCSVLALLALGSHNSGGGGYVDASAEVPEREIVVTADHRGDAVVPAEAELFSEEIDSYGADTIHELIKRLDPLVRAGQEGPVILVNGEPVGFDQTALSYPTEALARVSILKPEAAAVYGESAGRRVINLVLKKNFSMLNTDVGIEFSTAGGVGGRRVSANRTLISRGTRWNIQLRLKEDEALLKSDREIPARPGVFDRVGYLAALSGEELDPLLTAAAGRVVNFAAIPRIALSRSMELADVVETAEIRNAINPNHFETLRPARSSANLGIGVVRPIGQFSVSLNMNSTFSKSESLRGLPMGIYVLSKQNPHSPFLNDVLLVRPFAGTRALTNEYRSTGVSGSLGVSGVVSGWQGNLGFDYSRRRSSSLDEIGIDHSVVQALIDANDVTFNPLGRWEGSLLLANRAITNSETLRAIANLRKSIMDLPAGKVTIALLSEASWSSTRIEHIKSGDDQLRLSDVSRRQVASQATLNIPLTSREQAAKGFFGDVSADMTLGLQTFKNSRAQKRFGGSLNWSPWPEIQFRGSLEVMEFYPTFEQLDGPIVTVLNRVFDYAKREMAEPVWITGGAPDLVGGRRNSLSLNTMVRPIADQGLTINFGYRQALVKGEITTFPALTPAVEAAFPERIRRDGEGRLLEVDARAFNVERDFVSSIDTGIVFRFSPSKSGGGAEIKNTLRLSVSVDHQMVLKNTSLTRSGLDMTNQLDGGGQSRHHVSFQATGGVRGVGAALSGTWSSRARLEGRGDGSEDFWLEPPLLVNVSTFVEPDRLLPASTSSKFLRGTKFSLEIQNLFNNYNKVNLESGSVPVGYTRDEVDPVGRMVRFSVRKKF